MRWRALSVSIGVLNLLSLLEGSSEDLPFKISRCGDMALRTVSRFTHGKNLA